MPVSSRERPRRDQRTRMLEEPVPRLVLTLAVPTIISMMVTSIYNMADTYFVSQINTSASGAVGIVFSIMAIIQAVGFTIGMGSGSVASRLLGQGLPDRAAVIASSAVVAAVVCGSLLTLAGLGTLEHFVWILGATETIYPYALQYATYILWGAPVMCLAFTLNNLLRWQGKANRSVIGLGIGGVLNILLDPIFIFGLDLGISGAAIATLLSQCVSASILASFFLRGQSEIRVSIRCVSTAPKIYLTIFKSGMPSFFRQGMASVSAMALNFNAGVYGDAAVAAMAIVTKVFNFLLSAVIGFGQGMQPVVGYNYGAKELGRVRQAVSFSLKFCTVILTVAAAAGSLRRRSCSSSETTPRWWQWGHRHSDSNVSHCPWRRCWSLPICCSSLWANPGGRRCWPCAGRGCFLSPWCICCPCTLGCWVWR